MNTKFCTSSPNGPGVLSARVAVQPFEVCMLLMVVYEPEHNPSSANTSASSNLNMAQQSTLDTLTGSEILETPEFRVAPKHDKKLVSRNEHENL